jgi:mannonate dehydratase
MPSDLTRREWMQGSLAALASAQVAGSSMASAARAGRSGGAKSGIRLALFLEYEKKDRHTLAAQIGVTDAIVGVAHLLERVECGAYADTLAGIKREYEAAGLTIAGVESHPVPAEKIKLGLPGRDEELRNYEAAILALAQVGIPMVCYNFMAGLGWYRTAFNLPARGGALTSEFDARAAEAEGLTQWGRISEDTIWENMIYFQKAIMPVAHKVGMKMALHPDDPPISPLRGIGRILTSAANVRRVLDIVPSPINGLTFCQANFKAQGEDIEALAREWCREKKIFFVHFRDIEGTREHFRETFHDNGPTDMARMMRIYDENGFEGPMRPDHAPTLAGEAADTPGYAMMGKVLAIGYMRGLLEGLRAARA